MENNKIANEFNAITEFIDEPVQKLSLADKITAVATIRADYALFEKKEEEFTQDDIEDLNNILRSHVVTNGPHGLLMAARVGRAIRESIHYPIKPRTGLIQRFKNKVKELLS